jgi:glycosyltransferase involved in cell wall biosynthesis
MAGGAHPGPGPEVNWLGTVPHESLPALLRAADIGWVPFLDVPKLRKNIATKQFEYMACGLPVLGSDLPPIARFVTTARAGMLAPAGDPSAHAAAIAEIVQHPAKRHEMGIHGKKAFLTRYNWDTEEAKLIALYRALIGPPGEDEST